MMDLASRFPAGYQKFVRLVGTLVFCCTLGLGLPAASEKPYSQRDHGPRDGVRTDWVAVLKADRLGAAGWFVWPLTVEGIVPGLNDSVDGEVGGLITLGGSHHGLGLAPGFGAKWNLHLLPELTLFLVARVGFALGTQESPGAWTPGGSLGAYWHLDAGVDLRFEVENLLMPYVGISIPWGGE